LDALYNKQQKELILTTICNLYSKLRNQFSGLNTNVDPHFAETLASVCQILALSVLPHHGRVNYLPGSADIGGRRRTDSISKFWIIKMTFPRNTVSFQKAAICGSQQLWQMYSNCFAGRLLKWRPPHDQSQKRPYRVRFEMKNTV